MKLSLVIDLADNSQIETAGYRVELHYEVGIAARSLEPACASYDVKEALIHTSNWIQDSLNLNLNLVAVGSGDGCLSTGM